jgi:hypothetical protein
MTTVPELLERLKAAADTFDEESANGITEELAAGVVTGEYVPSAGEQKLAMDYLRGCRWFATMQRLGEALVSAGVATCRSRRQLAQGLIDQGLLDDALAVLQPLTTDASCEADEPAEVLGLVGRAHKQLYVDRHAQLGPARRLTLEASIRAYYEAYRMAPNRYYWQGMNAVAMIRRAERDRIPVSVPEPPATLAEAILNTVRTGQEPWEIATASEACVSLERWVEARDFMEAYVAHRGLDSFAAAGTLRQFQQVWQLQEEGVGGELITLLQAAVLRFAEGAGEKRTPSAALVLATGRLAVAEESARDRNDMLERVFGRDGPRSYTWYQLGLERARSVARIETLTGEGFGTGFLARAGDLLPGFRG